MGRWRRSYSRALLWLSIALSGGLDAVADEDPRDVRIWHELQAETHIDFKNVPLKDATDYLSDFHDIPIYLDTEAFEKAGVVHKRLEFTQKYLGVPLWKALRETLGQRKLSYMIKNHTLTFTTEEAAKEWQKKNIGAEN